MARAVIERLLEPVSRPVFLACRAALGPFYERFGFRAVGWSRMPPSIGCIYGLVLGALRLARMAAPLMGREKRRRLETIAKQAGATVLVMRRDR